MPPRAVHIDVGVIPGFEEEGPLRNVGRYVNIKHNCCLSHKDAGSTGDLMPMMLNAVQDLQRRPTSDVRASAQAGNADDCLEMGLR